jgi:hypothetical protein
LAAKDFDHFWGGNFFKGGRMPSFDSGEILQFSSIVFLPRWNSDKDWKIVFSLKYVWRKFFLYMCTLI